MGAAAQQNGGAGPGEPTTPRGGILRVSGRRSCRGATPVNSLHSSLSSVSSESSVTTTAAALTSGHTRTSSLRSSSLSVAESIRRLSSRLGSELDLPTSARGGARNSSRRHTTRFADAQMKVSDEQFWGDVKGGATPASRRSSSKGASKGGRLAFSRVSGLSRWSDIARRRSVDDSDCTELGAAEDERRRQMRSQEKTERLGGRHGSVDTALGFIRYGEWDDAEEGLKRRGRFAVSSETNLAPSPHREKVQARHHVMAAAQPPLLCRSRPELGCSRAGALPRVAAQ